jgi:hypothetical protein
MVFGIKDCQIRRLSFLKNTMSFNAELPVIFHIKDIFIKKLLLLTKKVSAGKLILEKEN